MSIEFHGTYFIDLVTLFDKLSNHIESTHKAPHIKVITHQYPENFVSPVLLNYSQHPTNNQTLPSYYNQTQFFGPFNYIQPPSYFGQNVFPYQPYSGLTKGRGRNNRRGHVINMGTLLFSVITGIVITTVLKMSYFNSILDLSLYLIVSILMMFLINLYLMILINTQGNLI